MFHINKCGQVTLATRLPVPAEGRGVGLMGGEGMINQTSKRPVKTSGTGVTA